MATLLNLDNPERLGDFSNSLARFSEAIQVHVGTMRQELAGTQTCVEQLLKQRERELREAVSLYEHAQQALRRCEAAQSHNTRDYSCESLRQQVEQARHRKVRAEDNKQRAKRAQHDIDMASKQFAFVASRLDLLGGAHSQKANLKLKHLHQYYIAVHRNASGGAGSGLSMNHAAPSIFDLPNGSLNNTIAVDVTQLPVPDDVHGPEDFHRIPEPQMRHGLELWWNRMRPEIESGIGLDADYWYAMDQEAGYDRANGYEAAFNALYGTDCISLVQGHDGLTINSGGHRIWLARQMGIPYLPIRFG